MTLMQDDYEACGFMQPAWAARKRKHGPYCHNSPVPGCHAAAF
jgi:hypothetical protein